MDVERAIALRSELQGRIADWISELLIYPGFREWKDIQIRSEMLATWADEPLSDLPDFEFPPDILRQHEIVSGYHDLLDSAIETRNCAAYFRAATSRPPTIDRQSHLQTCCELFFSRVYQFRERQEKLLKRIKRRSRASKLDIAPILKQFESRFSSIISARNDLHHHTAYTDFEIKGVGSADLVIGMQTPDWSSVSKWRYREIRLRWVKRVEDAADQLDLFVGANSYYILECCSFLTAKAVEKTKN